MILAAPQQKRAATQHLPNRSKPHGSLTNSSHAMGEDRPVPSRPRMSKAYRKMMMTDRMLLLSFGLMIGAALCAAPLAAQTANCAPHAVVVQRLAESYGESRQAIGLGSDNSVVETFASAETGTWTITVTRPGGPTCLVASGQAFELTVEALPNTDQGA
jgi:hypothetical protein